MYIVRMSHKTTYIEFLRDWIDQIFFKGGNMEFEQSKCIGVLRHQLELTI